MFFLMFTFIHKTKLLGEVDTFGAPFMRKLFSRAEGVLLVQVEVSKGVVDHPVMSLVRPDQKHRNNHKHETRTRKSEKLPDGQYDVPHQRLVREFPVVDGNLRRGQGAKKQMKK